MHCVHCLTARRILDFRESSRRAEFKRRCPESLPRRAGSARESYYYCYHYYYYYYCYYYYYFYYYYYYYYYFYYYYYYYYDYYHYYH